MADAIPTETAAPTNNGGNDDNTELFLAIAALVISIAAFVVSILQALQQYYSSARGYSSCGPKVIGKWAAFRHRRFLWYEFRFEVEFLTPVIFIARPDNTRGPMGSTERSKITVLDGSKESYEGACVLSQKELEEEERRKLSEPGRVHTADNERATWLDLLMAVEGMEVESRDWQGRYLDSEKRVEDSDVHWPPQGAGAGHTLTVCIQRKKKSWDTVPDNVPKPYATTTIAHMVELSAMLGVYWIVWNREDDRYLAQGNGFILSGSNIEGLGLTFSIQKKGPQKWGPNRTVPHNSVKELCFGFCPTTFRTRDDEDKASSEEALRLGSLQLGTMEEIAETLVVLGLNARNVNYFRDTETKARHSHLFPVAFEILGMLGVVLQVKGTVFRTLPNPTVFRWDTKSFDLLALLGEYRNALKESSSSNGTLDIASHLDAILSGFDEWKALPKFVSTTHTSSGAVATGTDSHDTYTPAIFTALHAAIEACDAHLNPQANREPNSLLRVVLRAHIQAVLSMINPGGSDVASPASPSGAPTIEELDAASDRKHAMLMEMYFGRVRPEVLSTEVLSKAHIHAAPESAQQAAGGIWDALVFRMLCWLVLHHFHEKDVQIGHRSDVFESRMPVYII
ncbi:hypothetical protein B0T16DRAFT_320581 [Cercophora newfieldiana]|uniref:Modin n=1 Tax=Cercophora newfieldiana TaxID=92897 RepID=A0AA40CVQ0_9PEZI|nr:hypothetical protein B0T16DRAFT_320581 [Cercophora newfieldiana]